MAKTPSINPYDNLEHGFEGGLYSGIHECAIRNTVADGEIPFGRLVEAGSDYGPGGIPIVSLASGSAADFYGIAVATDATEQPLDDDNTRGYRDKQAVPVLVKGIVNVIAESDVTPQDDVYARIALDDDPQTAPEYQGVGRFTATADGTNTVGPFESLRFLTEGKPGECIGLEVGVTIF